MIIPFLSGSLPRAYQPNIVIYFGMRNDTQMSLQRPTQEKRPEFPD
jgi:hypothetical protein